MTDLHQALDDPFEALKALLTHELGHLSSLEISRRTGVPSSTIRSARNGQHGSMKVANWATLMRWALREVEEKRAA